MYMPDLSTYRYWKRAREDVLAVGWLSKEHSFTRGPVDGEVRAKLTQLAVHKSSQRTRGIHRCEFCAEEEIWLQAPDGAEEMLGTAEVWIPGVGVMYAAPNLIVHYVIVHEYQPPQVYLDALRALDYATWVPSAWQ